MVGAGYQPGQPAPNRRSRAPPPVRYDSAVEGTKGAAAGGRGSGPVLVSQLCRYETLVSPAFLAWSDRIRPVWDPDGTDPKPYIVHRKMWEWLFICEALGQRKMLRPGRHGIGFGVGAEPLIALFAGLGCTVLATDQAPEQAVASGWARDGGEYAGALEGLQQPGLCDPDLLAARVSYRDVDMNDIPADLRGFDFSWSSCSFEHLGTIEAGLDFVVNQMDCLAPGGVAVHTTEFNASSDDETVESGPTVLYRRRDIEALVNRLRREGYRIYCDFTSGELPADRHVDVPPYTDTHLRTTYDRFEATSIGLVVEKPRRFGLGLRRR